MKNLKFTLLATFLIANFSYAEVDLDYLQNINELIAEKQYQEALKAHEYFFEESKNSSGMGGVRLSFALSSWAELGNVYPPALDSLFKISTAHKKLILSGKGTFSIFQEYQAINSYTGKNKETLETFLVADKEYPEQAKEYYWSAKELLIEEKKYDILKRYVSDPIFDYESIRNERERSLSELRKKATGYSLESINLTFESKVETLIEVTQKIGLLEQAEEIKNRSKSYMNGNLLRKYN